MVQLYKADLADYGFIAFWLANDQTLSWYIPGFLGGDYHDSDMAQWRFACKQIYDHQENDFALYDEAINAAEYFSMSRGLSLDKSRVRKSTIDPGVYFPRMWRGTHRVFESICHPSYRAFTPDKFYGYKYFQSMTAASSLFNSLTEIFRHVEPTIQNQMTYGHRIRELLILACTEIETGWRSILLENTSPENLPRSDRLNTIHYHRLKKPLCLNQWSAVLNEYPEMPPFRPFVAWDSNETTKSIPWYDAYNAVKHDREGAFSRATMKHLLDAMAALHIMLGAQWGIDLLGVSSPFGFVKIPQFPLGEIYMPPIDGTTAFRPICYFTA